MNKFVAGAAAAIAFGLGAMLVPATTAHAQTVAPEAVQSTQGGVTLDRARGGGGGARFHGGGGGVRHYGGGGYRGGYRSYRGGRYIVPGIAAGIVGGAILGGGYYYGGRSYSCSDLEYRCDRGDGWACRRLDVDSRC